MPVSKCDQLVETALSLFERSGFGAVGIDRVLAEAGVAKMTLYKHFQSKDELVAAALDLKDRRFRAWFINEVERRAAAPRDRLLAIFETLHDVVDQPTFPGCIFARAAAEFGPADHPVHVAAAEHKRLMRQYISTLAAAAGAADAERLSYQLAALMDGAMANLLIGGCADLCPAIFAAAQTLIDAALADAS
ncbi:MAG: TetR/AcrR family transcriptional regulator [Planctomycetota bacterium]